METVAPAQHSFNILCRCNEYRKIAINFTPYTIGAQNPVIQQINIGKIVENDKKKVYKYIQHFYVEPAAPIKVSWVPARSKINGDVSFPVFEFDTPAESKINAKTVDKKWIPVMEDLISLKLVTLIIPRVAQTVQKTNFCRSLGPNLSYLHETAKNTQSAVTSTLTGMLPHRGRAVRRKDMDWGTDYCMPPVPMTDIPETYFGHVQSCFSKWAEAYVGSTGLPPY